MIRTLAFLSSDDVAHIPYCRHSSPTRRPCSLEPLAVSPRDNVVAKHMRKTFFCVAPLVASCVFAAGTMVHAQPFADPGFGDPTTLTPPPAATVPGVTSGYPSAPPSMPSRPVRPDAWPGGRPTAVPGATSAPPAGAPVTAMVPQTTVAKASPSDPPYDPAEIIARVGAERLQACEMLPMINRAILNAVKDNEQFNALSPEDRQREIHRAQKNYMKQALQQMIDTKLLIAEVRSNADKKALDENEKKIRDHFNSEYLKQLQAEYGASSVIELENKLRELGGSIESQRALFVEQSLASGWLSQAVKAEKKEPTHDQMLTYFQKHSAQWDTPARARWEQITAKWENFGSRPEAIAALARWGDDVLVRNVPFADVAKAHSQEYAAEQGGTHDWVTQGSLRSQTIDQALFSLPVGAMSRILQDEEGCHIIRVVEREETKRASFADVQPEIKQALQSGGEAERKKEYIESLREKTPVWSIFDEAAAAPADALVR